MTRTALVCALIAAALNVASFVGPTSLVPSSLLVIMHAAVLLLFVTFFVRAGYERMRSAWRRDPEKTDDPLPRPLVWLAVAALVYFLGVLIGTAVVYGEGVTTPDAVSLRIFSAAWLFFLLLIALLSHGVETRLHSGKRALNLRESP